MHEEYVTAISALRGAPGSKHRTPAELGEMLATIIPEASRRIFAAGRSSILADFPAPPEEERIVLLLAQREIDYAQTLEFNSDAGSHSPLWHLENALDSIFSMGQLSVLPEGTKIDWILGADDRCRSCLLLLAGGPYGMPHSEFGLPLLPVVPRSRSLECGSSCSCRLSFDSICFGDIDRPTKLGGSIRGEDGRDRGLDDVQSDSPIGKAIEELDRIQAARVHWRQRVAAETDCNKEREAAKLVSRIQQNLTVRAEELGVDYRPNVRVSDYVKPIERLRKQGFVAANSESLHPSDIVARIEGLTVEMGTVVSDATCPSGLAIELASGQRRAVSIEREAPETDAILLRRQPI